MKTLKRTVPKPKGDDFAVHEDIMMLDIPVVIENESCDFKDCAYKGCYKKKELEDKDLCKGMIGLVQLSFGISVPTKRSIWRIINY